jgi:osmoprotectant transport system substrate-binding protein
MTHGRLARRSHLDRYAGKRARLATAAVLAAIAAVTSHSPAVAAGRAKPVLTIIIGPGETSATAITAELYAQALQARGISVKRAQSLNSRETSLAAMAKGQLDLYPERTNAFLTSLTRLQGTPADVEFGTTLALRRVLPAALTVLNPSRAEDGPAIVCNAVTTRKYSLTTVAGLATHGPSITIGGPPAFEFSTPFGLAGLRTNLNTTFASFVVFDNAPALVTALKANTTQCAALTTTHSSLTSEGFVALQDISGMFPDEVVIPVLAKAKATPAVVSAIDAVDRVLDTPGLAALVRRVEADRVAHATAAKDFLKQHRVT